MLANQIVYSVMHQTTQLSALEPKPVFGDNQGKIPVAAGAEVGYMLDGDSFKPVVLFKGAWLTAEILLNPRLLSRFESCGKEVALAA